MSNKDIQDSKNQEIKISFLSEGDCQKINPISSICNHSSVLMIFNDRVKCTNVTSKELFKLSFLEVLSNVGSSKRNSRKENKMDHKNHPKSKP